MKRGYDVNIPSIIMQNRKLTRGSDKRIEIDNASTEANLTQKIDGIISGPAEY